MMNYTPLDAAYNDTYLSQRFDIENTKRHTPTQNYEQVIDNVNHLKAQGQIPINEQIGEFRHQEKNGCLGIFSHIDSCASCRQKLGYLLGEKLQSAAQKQPDFKELFFSNPILLLLFICLGLLIVSIIFDFSVTFKSIKASSNRKEND